MPSLDIRVELERFRKELLDTTARNSLIKYRATRSKNIPIVNELPDQMFQHLVTDARAFRFEAVGQAREDVDAPLDGPAELPSGPGSTEQRRAVHRDDKLQIDLDEEAMERRLKAIRTFATTEVEETGGSSLYLAIGFLEWYEASDSSTPLSSPLFLIPVEVEREFDARRRRYGYTLRYNGNEVQTNLSLGEKLRREFGLVMPDIEPETTPEEYFTAVYDAIRSQPSWRVKREAAITFFSFAKLLMFRDLDPEQWPSGNGIDSKPLVQAIFEGQATDQASPGLYAEDYNVDANPRHRDLLLAVDADSSQHSALIDALDGRSMVVEGPPGTGKSQTITNMIAAAIAQGKSVLFVAEKMAALEVVQKNLARAGLGQHCLEMHSHKSKPAQVYASLKERLEARFLPPARLQSEAAQLQAERESIEQYLAATRQPVGPRNEPLYSVFWRATALRAAGAEPLPVPVETGLSEAQFQERLRFFGELAIHAREIGPADRALWAGYEPLRYYATDHGRAVSALAEMWEGAAAFRRASEAVASSGLAWPDLADAERLAGEPPVLVRPSLLSQSVCTALSRGVSRDEAFGIIVRIKRLRDVKTTRPEVWKLASSDELTQRCRLVLEVLTNRDFMRVMKRATIADLRRGVAELEGVLASMERLSGLFEAAERLRLGRPRNPEQLKGFCDKYRVLNDPAVADRSVIRPELFYPATRVALAQAKKRRDDIRGMAQAQELHFVLRDAPSREDLGHLRRRLRAGGTGLTRWWRRDYRRALAEQRAFRRAGSKLSATALLDALDGLDQFMSDREAFAADANLQRSLGPGFRGLDSAWGTIEEQIEWAQRAMGCGLSHQALIDLVRTLDEDVSPPSVQEVEYCADLVRRTLSTELLQELLGAVGGVWTVPFLDIVRLSRAFAEQLKLCTALFDDLDSLRLTDVEEARATFAEILEVRSVRDQIRADPGVPEFFGESYRAEDTDTAAAEATLAWADQVAASDIPPPLQRWLLARDTADRADALAAGIDAGREGWRRWSDGRAALGSMGEVAPGFGGVNDRADWAATCAHLAELKGNMESLLAWANLCRALQQGRELGLSAWLGNVMSGVESADHARRRYELTFWEAIARSEIQTRPALQRFSRQRIEHSRTEFQRMDRVVQGLARREMAFAAAQRVPPVGVSTGRVKDLTELSLIRREIQKTRAHCKLRQLMMRAGRAVQALKPCFLMSPITVAQHLPPGQVEFDLVIMDEASQIKPADAIGAIARAKQVVVVGDPKQLPPTSFFERASSGDIDEADEATLADEAESVLEVGLKAYPHARRLRWHYRSQHESLIAFSNERFYEGDLVVFPSPTAEAGRLGIRHHYVGGATYSRGKNLNEARAVAQAIIKHALGSPTESLGVGVFNSEQRDLIAECLDQECIRNPQVRSAVEQLQKLPEGLFIKNLENLQGDERDVIFIGYTYGPDAASGHVANRFGPITGDHGWRRLNVLITRARRRLEVFASMRSEQIHGGPDKSKGVNAMKDFLAYVETGKLVDRGIYSGRSPDSPFEEAVGKVVGDLGMGFVPQVGVAGYFVDIGVLAPGRDNEFILGIECDGASYHSAKSARDRDRLREEVIRLRGWTLHRIWSTDWFLNQPSEERRLAQVLTAAKRAWEARSGGGGVPVR